MLRLSWLTLFASVLFFGACNNNADPKNDQSTDTTEGDDIETVAAPRLQNDFPGLHQLFSTDSLYSPDKFQGGETEMQDTFLPVSINEQQLTPYLPYLIYNSNDSLAIDFVSYNYVLTKKEGKQVLQMGGPDSEIAIVDFLNKTRKRIFFTGASGTILNARWEDENTIIFVTATEEGDGQIKPSIIRYHANTGLYEMFTYQGGIRADITNYTEQQLNTNIRTSPVS